MCIPYWVDVIFHLPEGKKETYTIHQDEYQKIVNEVGVKGSISGKYAHFYVKNPNDSHVQKAIYIATQGYLDFLLDQA
jgi:hypothetical protein